MEFRLLDVQKQGAARPAPIQYYSDCNYFTLQAFRAGTLKPEDLDYRARIGVREAVLKEMEDEKIRGQIIADEISKMRRENEIRSFYAPQRHQFVAETIPAEAMSVRYRPSSLLDYPPVNGRILLEERLGRLAAERRERLIVVRQGVGSSWQA